MPKTKFQDFIFTIIMVVVMVYAMVCYNIAFDKGAMSGSVFLIAFHELPIMGVVGFLLEFLFVGKFAQKIVFKHFNPQNTKPFVITVTGVSDIVPNFLQICVRNFPMALCWQLFYAGPLVRAVFRFLFKKQLKD